MEKMTRRTAEEIHYLLKARNKLDITPSPEEIFLHAEEWKYLLNNNENLIACIQFKKIQWYQHEILHLSVNKRYEGRGFAARVYERAEENAIENGARLLQCTIRDDNSRSVSFFESHGFLYKNTFWNDRTNHSIHILQKITSYRRLVE